MARLSCSLVLILGKSLMTSRYGDSMKNSVHDVQDVIFGYSFNHIASENLIEEMKRSQFSLSKCP